jgi:hypothetical protein
MEVRQAETFPFDSISDSKAAEDSIVDNVSSNDQADGWDVQAR